MMTLVIQVMDEIVVINDSVLKLFALTMLYIFMRVKINTVRIIESNKSLHLYYVMIFILSYYFEGYVPLFSLCIKATSRH